MASRGDGDKPMPPSISKHAGSWPAAVQHTACPTDDTLIALVEDALPADARASLADHVDNCERCRATIGTLAAVDGGAKPRKVGRYELEDQLGAGAMGVVYAAFDPMLQRRVAIKLMHPEVGENGPARMLREARALAQLQHPNVVAVHDVGEHEGDVFLATELVDGEPLDRWQRGRTALEIVGAYAQAARGLAAAHAMGLVHRDVKPSNVLVARDGRVRVGDFGLARRGAVAGEIDPKLTREGDVVGTPAYMAPEQRAGLPVDGRADQFALCVALGEALTGKRPAAGSRPTLAARGMRKVATALARGLRIEPGTRFPDMAALAAALEAPLARRRRTWPVVVAGVIAAAAGSLAVVFMFGASPIVPQATLSPAPTLTKKVNPDPIVAPPALVPTGMPECDAHLATLAKLATCPSAPTPTRDAMRDAIDSFQHNLAVTPPAARAAIIQRGDYAKACIVMAKNTVKVGEFLACDMTLR